MKTYLSLSSTLLLIIATLFPRYPDPTEVRFWWSNVSQATMNWYQNSDADQVCIIKVDDQHSTLIDCITGHQGQMSYVIPPVPTDGMYVPHPGDKYQLVESREGQLYDVYGPYLLPWSYWTPFFSSA